MTIGIADHHEELARVVRAFLHDRDAIASARSTLDDPTSMLPVWWDEFVGMGWPALHVPEDHGGSGYGLLEAAVVAEELGRQCAPGPFLAMAAVTAALAERGSAAQRTDLLTPIATGDTSVGFGPGTGFVRTASGVSGTGVVLAASEATILAVVVDDDLALVDARGDRVEIVPRANLDPSLASAEVRLDDVSARADRTVVGGAEVARRWFGVLAAAQAAGVAAACTEMASGYALDRVAFGRPIGQFQAVKHRCADMLAAEQLAVAATWDAARSDASSPSATLAARAAVAVALPVAVENAQSNVQVHGGIGFTWEHDAHLFLRRAGALAALAGPTDVACDDVVTLVDEVGIGSGDVELPPEAEALVARTEEFRAHYEDTPETDRHRLLREHGYLYPQWPTPWGRDADALEQVVIDAVLSDIDRYAPFGDNEFAVPIIAPTLLEMGTEDQRRRWVHATLDGEIRWCQLFSEPGHGSDLAGLQTRAERAPGGWAVTGQKVWTSAAQSADLGFGLVRTDPASPRHRGITCVVVDMRAEGVTVRPLRTITGDASFNEVFLDDVFVPDADVIGDVNGGWAVARAMLGHERSSLGRRDVLKGDHWSMIRRAATSASDRIELGGLLAGAIAIRAMNLRIAARAIAGGAEGVEGNVTKLVSTLHHQRSADLGLRLAGPRGVFVDGDDGVAASEFLRSRYLTIAGGTSEILRNVIAERVLGLPRDQTR